MTMRMLMAVNRIVRRVPLDFNWKLGKIWKGFANPHYRECPDCENGYTKARKRLQNLVQLLLISAENSLRGENHSWCEYLPMTGQEVPSRDILELTEGLTGRKLDSLFGYDAIAQGDAENAIIKAAGLDPKVWGICPTCKGNAIDPEVKEKYENWQEEEPPKGEGYQLWETTSDGSPISPVFKTEDELCAWAAENSTVCGEKKLSKEEWHKVINDEITAVDIT